MEWSAFFLSPILIAGTNNQKREGTGSRRVRTQNSLPLGQVETFLLVAGNQSADVALAANDLRLAGRGVANHACVTVPVSEIVNPSPQ